MLLLRYFFYIIIIIGFDSCTSNSFNQKVPISDFKGIEKWFNKQNDSVYVINFWATWCSPCVKEFPVFEQFSKENMGEKVKVLMINLDFPDQYSTRLLPFLEQRKSKLDVIMLDDPNQNSWINKVDSTWSGSLPATLIYKRGKRLFMEKELTYSELKLELEKINH